MRNECSLAASLRITVVRIARVWFAGVRIAGVWIAGVWISGTAAAQPPIPSSEAPTQQSVQAASLQSAEPPAGLPTGDPARGRQIFAPCRTCHYPEKGYGHHNGPSLFAIFGRQAGTQEGFLYYSDAMKRSNFIWTPALLNAWLANPKSFLPGTSMMFVGLAGARERADLIAYLAQFRDP